MPDEYTGTSGAGPVKCDHIWMLKENDGHVRTYVCDTCGKVHYQEAAHDASKEGR